MLDLRLLQQAVTLARTRSFARAAEVLHLTQPALSRSIAGLESALGEKLFDRTPQGVTPTAYGAMLLARAEKLLAESREVERDFRLLRGLDIGELRVGVGPYPAAISAGRAIGELLAEHPALQVEVVQRDIREMAEAVRARELDLAVMELSIADDMPELATEALPQHPGFFIVRAGHPLVRAEPAGVEEIARFPLITNRLAARFSAPIATLIRGRADGRDLLPQVRIVSVGLALDIARHSDAVALAPLQTAAEDVAAGRLVALPFRLPAMHTNYGFVVHRDRAPSPAALAFMAVLRRVEAEVAAAEADPVNARNTRNAGRRSAAGRKGPAAKRSAAPRPRAVR
jgi:DNA-binding transcriptional LysR family regulator